MAAESYRLEVTGSKIELRAGDAAGAFYGLISLAALIDPRSLSLPRLTLNDGPRFAFRGMHIDVARNFRSRRFILALLDQMANYKLNKLHLHLADDEGWRLAIAGLPELTAIGARRCHDLEENRCLLPQLGSGATSEAGRDGFYSAEDYQAILRAATARHIQVIPSFDMPGHSRAAVKAMEARFRRLTAEGEAAEAERYLLSDPDDQTRYRSTQRYNDNTINVCMASSYHFVGKVIDEVKRLHDRAGHPLTRYHIGADETAGAWLESPRCKAFIAAEKRLTDAGQLAGYFIERVAAMLDERGIEPAAWSDGMAHPAIETLPAIVQTNSWETLYGGGQRTPHTQLNRGWQVVLSTPDALYYDFPYQADPKEPGYNWATRHIDTRKVFEFMPENLPVHAEFWFDKQDRPFTFDDRLLRDETRGGDPRPHRTGSPLPRYSGPALGGNRAFGQAGRVQDFSAPARPRRARLASGRLGGALRPLGRAVQPPQRPFRRPKARPARRALEPVCQPGRPVGTGQAGQGRDLLPYSHRGRRDKQRPAAGQYHLPRVCRSSTGRVRAAGGITGGRCRYPGPVESARPVPGSAEEGPRHPGTLSHLLCRYADPGRRAL